jgi:hypothetical protein
MSSKSSLPSLGASGRYNMSEYEYDRLHSFNEQDYHWTYGGMERSGNSFRGSSGFTSSERASSSSDGGGGGGGGGGGFDSGGSGGGGGGGGDF